jgi:hypothetical protein
MYNIARDSPRTFSRYFVIPGITTLESNDGTDKNNTCTSGCARALVETAPGWQIYGWDTTPLQYRND